jgi:pyridoxal phosphate enzyme (YggS family)
MMSISRNLKQIQEEIRVAAMEAGRNPEEITLVAVSKTYGSEAINEAISAGAADIGENKVQEILDKYEKVLPVRWHMIGHLQTNKVKYIVDKVSMIHSVDSMKLAEEISRRCLPSGRQMDILIQINGGMESNKYGVAPEEAKDLAVKIGQQCPGVRIRGLMCVVPYLEDPESVRPYFREAKEIFDQCREEMEESSGFDCLSMGMSHDFHVAIQEGATHVRVGTSIFGARDYTIK